MKRRVFFLLVLPVVWFAIALMAVRFNPDRAYALAIAPSAWLTLFGDLFSRPLLHLQLAGLPAMFVIGLILMVLKMTPRAAIAWSLVMTAVSWGIFVFVFRQSRVMQASGAPFAWFLCWLNFSLCLLPVIALLSIIGRWSIDRVRGMRTGMNTPSNQASEDIGAGAPNPQR